MILLGDNIPGFREARFRERLIRDAAFLGIAERVGAFELVPMTLRHYAILKLACPVMLNGGVPEPEELAAFLWILSPKFRPDGRGRWRFMRRCRAFISPPAPAPWRKRAVVKWEQKRAHAYEVARETIAAVREYIDDTLMDRPPSTGESRVSYYSEIASCVGTLAHAYGWSYERIIDMPIKLVFQFMSEIRDEAGMTASLSNPLSERVESEYLRSLSHGNTN